MAWPQGAFEEMVQDMQQDQHVLPVAGGLGLPNIVHNHVADFFASTVLGQKVLSERRRGDFWKVFMFGNGEHLRFGQAAEGDAIFQVIMGEPGSVALRLMSHRNAGHRLDLDQCHTLSWR